MAVQSLDGAVAAYIAGSELAPLFLLGDALHTLTRIPDETIDCCMTSPPYWRHRRYDQAGIGLEATHSAYLRNLVAILGQVRRVLKPTGSLWLNIGDSYEHKNLVGIPWRVAMTLTDTGDWWLRNDIIWNKVKGGPDNTRDRLRNVHEHLFHLVRQPHNYYYDVDSIRSHPRRAKVVNGAVVSATGVRGVRYRRQIELSTALSEAERQAALRALDDMLDRVAAGAIADFRMIIRGQQRATHSDSEQVSGRARELREKGFYFLLYHPHGSKPGDVWDILPEDTQRRSGHFAPYPADLCHIPLLATCPPAGIVLDPFCGTGTTMLVAHHLGRKSIGIDLSPTYLEIAAHRCRGRIL